MSEAFAHDSWLGGLNLLKRFDSRAILKAGERPPYPIIIFRPTATDIVKSLNRADLGIFLFYCVLGKEKSYFHMKIYSRIPFVESSSRRP